jgi:hypothetical protein
MMQKESEYYLMFLQLNSQIGCNILFFHTIHMLRNQKILIKYSHSTAYVRVVI